MIGGKSFAEGNLNKQNDNIIALASPMIYITPSVSSSISASPRTDNGVINSIFSSSPAPTLSPYSSANPDFNNGTRGSSIILISPTPSSSTNPYSSLSPNINGTDNNLN